MKLTYEVYKNLKLIFRNWNSLLLIVIAPILLILLVGYSMSSEALHDIKIGVVSENNIDDFVQATKNFSSVIKFARIEQCILEMYGGNIHICLEITGNLSSGEEFPSGEVKFYYDSTRKRISILLLTEIKEYFGLTSERISLIATEQIFDSLQSLLAYLNSKIDDIDKLELKGEDIKTDLMERRARLIDLRDDFTPKYLIIKSAQQKINDSIIPFYNATGSLLIALEDINNATAEIENLLISSEIAAVYNISIIQSIMELRKQAKAVENSITPSIVELQKIKSNLDELVKQLDEINIFLNEEIRRTDEYIALIDQSIIEIHQIQREAEQRMKSLSKLDPSLASKLLNPIIQSFTAIIFKIKDIQAAFPMLLSTVIVFISILFANIVTLLELNNKAYVRNILAPVDDIIYTTGIALTSFLIVLLQVIILLIVAQTRFGVDIISHLPNILPIIIVLIITFVFMGMALAYLSKNIQTSILLSTFVALAFFLFSDALNVPEAMPELAYKIVLFNPLVIVNMMLRRILFFDATFFSMLSHFGLLLVYALITGAALLFFSKRFSKKRI